jgi:uncharacterized repeat protein (TIGR03847 family)
MSRSFHFDEPDHFTAGTVGPPGQRVFYLQARSQGEVVSFKLEKQQVAALADYLRGLLADLPAPDQPLSPAAPLIEPIEPEWTVGGIGIAVDEAADRILLVVHELVPGAQDDAAEAAEVAELLAELAGLELHDDGEEDDEEDDLELDELDEDSDAAMARVRLTRDQVAAFIERAGELMAAGRPLCPFCGLPSDPEGHICPRAN